MSNSHQPFGPYPPPLKVSSFVWGLAALFYLVGFFHRVAPAVMTAELMKEFEIGATALGNLSAFYFYSYVAMQIPTGILADLWGPRRLLSMGTLIAGIGTFMFALSPTIVWAYGGRMLIGGSVAVAFVGLLRLASNWFPPHRYATLTGLALFFGIIGAVSAGAPLRLLIDEFSWRSILLVTGFFSLALGAAIWFLVRDFPHEKGYADLTITEEAGTVTFQPGILKGLVQVFRYRNTWLLMVIPAGLVGAVLTFSGLWGVPYLTTHHGLTTSWAAALTSLLMVAWAVGGPIFGGLSDRLCKRKPLYIGGCALALSGWIQIIYMEDIPFAFLVLLLLFTGFSSGCMVITFAYAKESVPLRLAGTVSGVANMGVMLGPTILQPVMGWILDLKWQGGISEGVRLYGIESYQAGFSLMIGWVAVSLVLLFFTCETDCRQKN